MNTRFSGRRRALLLGMALLNALMSYAQSVAAPGRGTDAATTALALRKLTVLGSVLYVAAHPDDENTRLIAYLANERLVRTGYLSLTRGDGGQNLIGSEIREKLGVIRTQELLAARRIDGGEQFFTRANDFGFSKTPVEALRIWDKEQVLADVVRTIRRFRPDVIITRFSPEPMNTHGHHTASAQLALEAFRVAADPKRFPEQLAGGSEGENLEPWQAKRILWNTSSFFFDNNPNWDKSGLYTLDVGGYNSLLGKSYGEIAALSRSQHRSQGFGSAGTRGEAIEYFKLLAGEPLPTEAAQPGKADLLAGVDLTWNREPWGNPIGQRLKHIVEHFNPAQPEASVSELLRVQMDLLRPGIKGFQWARTFNQKKASALHQAFFASPWRIQKLNEVEDVLGRCSGLFVRATASDWALTSGQKASVTLEIVKRTNLPVTTLRLRIPELGFDSTLNQILLLNKPLQIRVRRTVDLKLSQPYWLKEEPSVGMYRVSSPQLIGEPENAPILTARLSIIPAEVDTRHIDDVDVMNFYLPVTYHRVDPADGEIVRPLAVVPPVAVSVTEPVVIYPDGKARPVSVRVRAGQTATKGTLKLEVPTGWKVEPAEQTFDVSASGAEQTLTAQVTPPPGQEAAEGTLRAIATLADGRTSDRDQQVIHYPHIPDQVLFPAATTHLVRADIKRRGQQIGYVMGAGDDVPTSLHQLGYTVTLLNEADVEPASLRRFDAVVVGVRAYNTLNWLRVRQPALLGYVQEGGTLVVQYNTDQRLTTPDLGPYPITLSRDRVTDETAAVEFLHPDDPLLNQPNHITAADFQGWVQEQGLYYPAKWDDHYTPLFRSHDPDEKPLDGALLVAHYGKGTYIYTGLSFFRELPAGVPGALRLFANFLSVKK